MNPNFWITLASIILAVLGAVYAAYGFLDIKIFKTLTESFAFGVIGGIIFGSVLGLLITLAAVDAFIELHWSITEYYQEGLPTWILGVVVGVIFGFSVGFVLSRQQRGETSLREGDLWKRWSFFVSVLFLLLSWCLLYLFGVNPLGIFGLLLSGFAMGVISEQAGIVHTKLLVKLILGGIGVQVLLLLAAALIPSSFVDVRWWFFIKPEIALEVAVPVFIFSYLIGSEA